MTNSFRLTGISGFTLGMLGIAICCFGMAFFIDLIQYSSFSAKEAVTAIGCAGCGLFTLLAGLSILLRYKYSWHVAQLALLISFVAYVVFGWSFVDGFSLNEPESLLLLFFALLPGLYFLINLLCIRGNAYKAEFLSTGSYNSHNESLTRSQQLVPFQATGGYLVILGVIIASIILYDISTSLTHGPPAEMTLFIIILLMAVCTVCVGVLHVLKIKWSWYISIAMLALGLLLWLTISAFIAGAVEYSDMDETLYALGTAITGLSLFTGEIIKLTSRAITVPLGIVSRQPDNMSDLLDGDF